MYKKATYLGILFAILFMLSACTHPSKPEILSTEGTSESKVLSTVITSEPEILPTEEVSQPTSSNLDTSNFEVLEENEYYQLLYSNFMYYYTIFDKDHNIAKSEGPLNRHPHLVLIDNNLVRFTLQAGTGLSTQWGYYYNIQTGEFSDIFYSIHDQYDGKVAYTELDKVVIQDIFDADKYYYEISSFQYPLSSSVAADKITSVKFVNDGASVEISYWSGEDYHEVTETVDLMPDLSDQLPQTHTGESL